MEFNFSFLLLLGVSLLSEPLLFGVTGEEVVTEAACSPGGDCEYEGDTDFEIVQNGVTLPKEVRDRSAWYGSEMSSHEAKWMYNITKNDIADINRGLDMAKRKYIAQLGKENYEQGEISELSANDFDLGRFGETVKMIQEEVVWGQGLYFIRGLPIQDYTRWEVCTIYFMVGLLMGTPVSQNAKGHVLGHVKDLGDDHTLPETRIYRTHYKQRFHTDEADVVALLCLHQSKSGGESYAASTSTIYNELRKRYPEAAKILSEDLYWDRKNEVPAGSLPYFEQPVFNYYDGYMSTFVDATYVEAAHKRYADEIGSMPPKVSKAIALFEQVADEVKLQMEFRPGDIQLVNNFSITHARGTYEDFDEPENRRHLLRLWLSIKNGRKVPPSYGVHNGIVVEGTVLHAPLEAV